MNSKNQKTLERVFSNPVPANIPWKDIENMLLGLGATISEGNGSRVRVKLDQERAVFHRPHPDRNTDKGAVKSVRKFLMNAGVEL